MNPLVYSVVHVLSGFALVAFTFQAFIAPHPQYRQRLMIYTGTASLLMVIAGFGLQATLKTGFPLWLVIKLGCWLGVSLLSGLAFRTPLFARMYSVLALILIAIAVYCVYFKPV
jgi:NhaP-type Na+/H+ and K+/H+ antiporter